MDLCCPLQAIGATHERKKAKLGVKVSKQFEATIDIRLCRRITGGFVIAVLLKILIGSVSSRSAQVAAGDADCVAHSDAVIGALERTMRGGTPSFERGRKARIADSSPATAADRLCAPVRQSGDPNAVDRA